MDEARGEEATQSGQQQQSILSGGVYLRHRLRKASFPKKSAYPAFLTQALYHIRRRRASLAFGRSGVQETVPFFD